MANKVAWLRPIENKYGESVYTSKDGRFTITKKKYSMPYATVGYTLEGKGVPKWARDNDKLADAKGNAQSVIDDEEETSAKPAAS